MNCSSIKWMIFPLLLCVGSLSTGCSTWEKLDRTEKGAVIGGGSGALIGSAVSDSAAGPLIGGAGGALAGGLIGRTTEDDDWDN